MTVGEYIRLVAKIAVLKEIAYDYPGKTIENIIMQMEAVKTEVCNDGQSVNEIQNNKQ